MNAKITVGQSDWYPDLVQLNTKRTVLDGVGRDLLESTVSDYLAVLGTAMTVFETNGDYATGARPRGWCRLMDELSKPSGGGAGAAEAIASGLWSCRADCRRIALEAMETHGPADLDRCVGGLRVHAVPLRVDGEIVGSVSVGVGAPPSSEAQLQTLADRLGTSVERLRCEAAAFKPVSIDAENLACQSVEATARLLGEVIAQRRTNEAREHSRELYTGMIAHDLRSPLSAIRFGVDSLLKSTDPEAHGAERLQGIGRNVQRMSRMVEDLLDLTRAHVGGGIPLRYEPQTVASLLSESIDEFRNVHPRHIVRFRSVGDTTLDGDGTRLREVIENLLGNAARHGEGTPVDVDVTGFPREVVLHVHNGGPAIPSNVLATIFDPFARGTAGPEERSSGLGLGLFIAHEFVRAHGGAITVESSESSGTTFTVHLPRRAPA